MTAFRFSCLAAILFGLFSLHAMVFAIPNALAYPRDVVDDALRFGSILTAGLAGIALVVPWRLLPALRRLAERTTPLPLQIVGAVVMVASLIAARLSDTLTPVVAVPLLILFLLAFVLPGLAFRNLTLLPVEDMTLRELGERVRVERRRGPAYRRPIPWVVIGLWSLGFLPLLLDLQTIPAPGRASLAPWIAFVVGVMAAVEYFRLTASQVPQAARWRVLPRLALMSVPLCGLLAFGYGLLLLRTVPSAAAAVWGAEASLSATVAGTRARISKGCHGEVHVRTPAGVHKICNLSPDFRTSLSPGDAVAIEGRTTVLGLAIGNVRRGG